MTKFGDIFSEFFNTTPREQGGFHPPPAPVQQPVFDYNRVRSDVLKDLIRRKSCYVKSDGKTYKLTAVEVEVTR